MLRVVIESPYAGDIEKNINYARRCMVDSLKRNEAPLASHLLYTQPGILNDAIEAERALGIEAGFEWLKQAEKHVFYVDLGWSKGMRYAYDLAKTRKTPIEIRKID